MTDLEMFLAISNVATALIAASFWNECRRASQLTHEALLHAKQSEALGIKAAAYAAQLEKRLAEAPND